MRASSQYPNGYDIFLHLDGSSLVLNADDTYRKRPEISIYTEGTVPMSIEEAESLAHQILSLCQDIRERKKKCATST